MIKPFESDTKWWYKNEMILFCLQIANNRFLINFTIQSKKRWISKEGRGTRAEVEKTLAFILSLSLSLSLSISLFFILFMLQLQLKMCFFMFFSKKDHQNIHINWGQLVCETIFTPTLCSYIYLVLALNLISCMIHNFLYLSYQSKMKAVIKYISRIDNHL